jgi:hypothetical protein
VPSRSAPVNTADEMRNYRLYGGRNRYSSSNYDVHYGLVLKSAGLSTEPILCKAADWAYACFEGFICDAWGGIPAAVGLKKMLLEGIEALL